MIKNDKVSIISPVYNSEKYLKKMIHSVMKQSHKNWELILVDDCSTDKSRHIIKKFKTKKIKFFLNKKNYGAGYSRNIGTKHAKGRYITFIDSDDYWHKEYLKKTLKFLKRNRYYFVFTSYYWVSEEGYIRGIFKIPEKVSYNNILKSNPISCLTRMYDCYKLGKVLSPKLKIRQDFVFCLKILKKIKFAYGLNHPLAYRRLRSNSLSNNKFKSALYQFYVYYKYENLNIFKSLYYLSCWFILGLIKHFKNYGFK